MVGTHALTTTRHAGGDALLRRLLTRGWEFDFSQAVWLLERYATERLPVGHRGPVGGEAFRFRPHVSVGFPPTDVRRISSCGDPRSEEGFYRIDVTFMGLYGVSTPLPLHYAIDVLRGVEAPNTSPVERAGDTGSERAGASEQESDTTPTRDFLDILHHRVISLFYRSLLKYRYDRQFGLSGRDVLTDYLLWLVGCPRSYGESALGLSPLRMVRYAGVLTQRPKSATTLEGILSDYWDGLPIQVEQCVGRWVPLHAKDMNSIGLCNSRLGEDLTVGEQVYDLNGTFNVAVGPVDWATYESLLPDGRRFAETRSLVQLYCPDPLSFTIEVRLQAKQVPQMRLSSDVETGRLGYTSWGRTDEMPETSVIFDTTGPRPLEGQAALREESAEAVAA
jgi:type VI secretion system protein ImpH